MVRTTPTTRPGTKEPTIATGALPTSVADACFSCGPSNDGPAVRASVCESIRITTRTTGPWANSGTVASARKRAAHPTPSPQPPEGALVCGDTIVIGENST